MGEDAALARLARTVTGLSQVGLASLLGVGQATISRWEAGRSPIGDYHRALLDRVISQPKQNLSVIHYLLQHGRVADALFVGMGGNILIAGGDHDPV